MKWNTVLLGAGLVGVGVVGASQGLRPDAPAEKTTYWANGKLQSRVETSDGIPNGRSVRWHPDGTKHAEGVLRDGRMEGAWEFWLPSGATDAERSGTYRDGVRIAEDAGEGRAGAS